MVTNRAKRRVTVVGIVTFYLTKFHEGGTLHDLKFEVVDAEVKRHFPESKFNRFHFAHYKHKFLLKLDYVPMYRHP